MASTKLITPPAVEPLTLADAKLHLRVLGTEEDGLITSLITAARQYCEQFQRRAYITQTWELALDAWPGTGPLELPYPPLQSVESITYIDSTGMEQVMPPAAYAVDTASEPGRIVPVNGWPSVWHTGGPVIRVRYTAGYGATGANVPATALHAMRLLITHWVENREAVVVGQTANKVPLAAESLLWLGRVG